MDRIEMQHYPLEKGRDEMEEASKLWGPSTYEKYRPLDDISLKEYVDTRFADVQFAADTRFADMQKAVDLRAAIVQKAVDKAELDISQRFDDAKVYVGYTLYYQSARSR